jgi:hypothetical protein
MATPAVGLWVPALPNGRGTGERPVVKNLTSEGCER